MTLLLSLFALLILSLSAHAAGDAPVLDPSHSKSVVGESAIGEPAAGEQTLPGPALAARFCTQCHAMPAPSQLPKEAWPELFRAMNELIDSWPTPGTHAAKTLPPRQHWDEASNAAMLEYFIEQAPSEDQIRSATRKPAALTLSEAEFQPTRVWLPAGHFLTMLDYDARNDLMLLGLGQTVLDDGEVKLLNANAFGMVSPSGNMTSITKHASPPIHVDLLEDSFRLTLIGDLAQDTGEGEVIEFSSRQGKPVQTSLLRDLPRPVSSHTLDFDADGVEDLLVVGFGGNRGTGESAIYWGGSASPVEAKQILFPASGSVAAEVADFDGNGKPDILILIAQRTQALRLYLNRGERRFEEHTLIQRPVGWGFMDLAVADIDADGDLDIITVAGNNMEFSSAPLKPYHGIRIWLNETRLGTPSLHEAYFYPLFGAGQVVVVDADGDGALDLAATSLAPDWKEEWPENFVLLRRIAPGAGGARAQGETGRADQAGLAFQPYHIAPAHWRRWTYLSVGGALPGGGNAVLLGDTSLPFGAPGQAPARLQKMLESASRIYSLELAPGHEAAK